MAAESQLDLNLSDGLEILCRLFQGETISYLIDKLDDRAVSGFQKFLWEKTVEFGIICRGKNFDRREITKKMKPTTDFQREQRCTQPVYNCKGTHCINSNPKCARKKIQEHINVLAESIQNYIGLVKKQYLY